MEIGHEIISTVILSLAGADSSRAVDCYWRKDMYLVLVHRWVSLPRNSVVSLTDLLDMTIIVDWDVKPQIKQTVCANCVDPYQIRFGLV